MNLRKIISGGQTGADQGALSACRMHGFPYGGWIPRGRRSEKGRVPLKYRALKEHRSRHYPPRTERNVKISDGTVIFTYGKPDGGSLLTIDFAKKHGKPCLKVDLDQPYDRTMARIVRWLKGVEARRGILNVAGSRRSKAPGIHLAVRRVVGDLIRQTEPPKVRKT